MTAVVREGGRSARQRGRVVAALAALIAVPLVFDAVRPSSVKRTEIPKRVVTDLARASDRQAQSSVWFCAGGAVRTGATRDAPARLSVTVTNPGAIPSRGHLTWVIGGEPNTVVQVEVPAGSVQAFRLEDSVPQISGALAKGQSSGAGAILEFDRGGLAVDHRVETASSGSTAPCASSVGERAVALGGSTSLGTQTLITILNPFPGDAVFDIRFFTDSGTTKPTVVRGITVASESIRLVDIGAIVRRRRVVDTEVIARTGRVIVDRTTIVRDGPSRGIVLGTSAALPSIRAFFTSGFLSRNREERYEIVNPGDSPTRLDVAVLVAPPVAGEAPSEIVPFQLDVAAGTREELDLANTEVPAGRDFSVVFTGTRPFLAARVVSARPDKTGLGRGPATTPGAETGATQWILPANAAALTIFNVSSDPTTATVKSSTGSVLATMKVAPGASRDVAVPPSTAPGGQALLVEADFPVLVGRRFSATSPVNSWALPLAIVTDEGLVP